jgi:hypothetical protein
MGIKNKVTNKLTNKFGNKVLNIEEIDAKNNLPTTNDEIANRRERAEALIRKKGYFIF